MIYYVLLKLDMPLAIPWKLCRPQQNNQNNKSLQKHWMAPVPKPDRKCAKGKPSKNIIESGVYVRLDIREGNGVSSKNSVEDFQVLGIYTKLYNKWLLCERGWQHWNHDIDKGKHQVLLRMIVLYH